VPLSVVSASFRFRFFLIRELTRVTSRINECARLYEILLAHRVYAAFISTICQILDSFVRILNTRPAIRDPLQLTAVAFTHVYEVSPRKDRRGAALISDALPFGALLCGEPNAISNAIDYIKHRSRSHRAVIRVYDAIGNVIETDEPARSHADRCRMHRPCGFQPKLPS